MRSFIICNHHQILLEIFNQNMRWEGYVIIMLQRRGVYGVLVRQPAGKRTFGRPRLRWEDSIGRDLQKFGWGFGLN
jgi:hypothetical protein